MSLFRTTAVFAKPPDLLHNIYSPRARRVAAVCEPSAPGSASAALAQSAAPGPFAEPAGRSRRPPPGTEQPDTVETKAERSPCCNSRGPGREKVPDKARRAQLRAGLEVDKILRPFHSYIK